MPDTSTYATKNLHRSLERVRSCSRLPFHIPESTYVYVDGLLPCCSDLKTGLFDVLFSSNDQSLDEAIISAAVPTELMGPLQRLRNRHIDLQLEKESAIRAQRFCDAKAILKWQRDVDSLIAKLVPKHMRVSPDTVVSAIRSLGYNGPLPDVDQGSGEPGDARESPR
ncbi:hypothetical protein LOC67_27085 [Stieleria sp. JC731]|uniref:hypothetical protein n=1 Tax=Stieleria sp. JC731 TaxID=2894195 RepID=UPI001E352901|nr:hypothetical protein [Stieleria sp. JC731]MCC9604235.1 hypothetical protein [Stieleria sp. JC731]